jgi:hypothetical protein
MGSFKKPGGFSLYFRLDKVALSLALECRYTNNWFGKAVLSLISSMRPFFV